LYSIESALREQIERADDVLFDEIGVVLGEEDSEILRRLRWRRTRSLYPPASSELPYGRVDLCVLLEGIDPPVKVNDARSIGRWRDTFESQIAASFRASRVMQGAFYSALGDAWELADRVAESEGRGERMTA